MRKNNRKTRSLRDACLRERWDWWGRTELIVTSIERHHWLNWRVGIWKKQVCRRERSSLTSVKVDLVLKSWPQSVCTGLFSSGQEVNEVSHLDICLYVISIQTFLSPWILGLHEQSPRFYAGFLHPPFSMEENMYINDSYSFLFPIVPVFMTNFANTAPFICTLSLESSALLTGCSIFIKSGCFKDALFLMKFNQRVFIALFLPIFFPAWHIVYLVSIIAIFPCCHLTHSSLFALLLNAPALISSECPYFQLASSLQISCGQMSHLSTCTFGDFSQHLFRLYQSWSHNKQQLCKWRARLTQWLMPLDGCLPSSWESQGPLLFYFEGCSCTCHGLWENKAELPIPGPLFFFSYCISLSVVTICHN